jgi:3-dehydroquinate dehydratase
VIEVHISNVRRRADFRTIRSCRRVLTTPGLAAEGYLLALRRAARLLEAEA